MQQSTGGTAMGGKVGYYLRGRSELIDEQMDGYLHSLISSCITIKSVIF